MTHGSREETGVRSPDCGGGDLVRAEGEGDEYRADESWTGVNGERTQERRATSFGREYGEWKGERATGSSRISSVGVCSTITVSLAVPSW